MTNKTIDFLKVLHLRGPNIWTYRSVLEAWVDIHDLEDCPSNVIPGLPDRLTTLLPTLIEHRCSIGERGGFVKRLHDGTWPGHILEHVTLELQNLAGIPGGFGKARETSERGVYKVVIRAWQKDVSLAALHMGRDLLMAAIEDRPYDVDAAVANLRDLIDDYMLGPSTRCIVEAAADKQRRIPYIRLLTEGNLVQLGYGARQRRIWTAETDRTSAIAEGIAQDKDFTKRLLTACGETTLLSGGGIGTAPLFGLAKRLLAAGKTPVAVLGFNTAEDVFYENEFKALGVQTVIATADEEHDAVPIVTAAGLTKTMAPRTPETISELPLPRIDCDIHDYYRNIAAVVNGEAEQIVTHDQQRQLGALLDGYEQLREFDRRELALIEPLRTLRLIHYSAWLARRWSDPIFPINFPWFGSSDYWRGQVDMLHEQIEAMQEEPLVG